MNSSGVVNQAQVDLVVMGTHPAKADAHLFKYIIVINPRCACVARVTAVTLSICLSVP